MKKINKFVILIAISLLASYILASNLELKNDDSHIETVQYKTKDDSSVESSITSIKIITNFGFKKHS